MSASFTPAIFPVARSLRAGRRRGEVDGEALVDVGLDLHLEVARGLLAVRQDAQAMAPRRQLAAQGGAPEATAAEVDVGPAGRRDQREEGGAAAGRRSRG